MFIGTYICQNGHKFYTRSQDTPTPRRDCPHARKDFPQPKSKKDPLRGKCPKTGKLYRVDPVNQL